MQRNCGDIQRVVLRLEQIKMKKKLYWIIVGIILIAFSGIYAVVNKNISIYDKKIDTTNYVSYPISAENEISQTFISPEDKINGINVKMGVVGNQNNKKIAYKLNDENGKTVASGEATLEKLKSGKFFYMRFDPVENCKGKEYTFVISVEECEPTEQIVIYATPEVDDDKTLKVNENKVDSTMVLRVVNHRFDFETFFVTAIFLLYVVSFVNWLSKVFK